MAKILSKLFLLLMAVVGGVVHAIHDPAYTGIKTRPYRRDPSIAQAFEQQQQQHPNSRNYQVTNVDAAEGLSAIYNQNHNIQYHHQKQQQQSQGHYHHQQEQPIYQRNLQERHLASTPQKSNLNSADNAITEYYTGCPVQFTGQLPYAYDCRRFLNCWNGRGHIQSCAAGTVFNPETLECDRPDKVLCGISSSLTGLATQQQKPPSPDRAGRLMDATIDLCPAGVTGLQPHPTDCTKFVNCANGHVHIQKCGPGTAYSIGMMVCDFKHKVDCGGREVGVVSVTQGQTESRSPYDYSNGGSKSYVGGEGSQINSWVSTDASLNHPMQGKAQPVNRDYNTHYESHHTSNSAATHTQTDGGYGDRWTNMNRPRPEANAQQHTSTYGVTNQNTASGASTASVPSWSGEGSSIHRLTPSQSVLYVEGSLQPNRNYVNSIKSYSAPLAPFSPTITVSDAADTTTKTNIYYAQPVGSDEDSQETFNHMTGPPTDPNTDNSYINRQNHSKEINYSASVIPQAQSVQIPYQSLLPPYRSITAQKPITSQDSMHDITVPSTYLMPPLPSDGGQRPQKESEYRITSIDLDRLPGNAQFDLSVHDQYPSRAHATPAVPLDGSNLYGGLKPPLPPTPPEPTTPMQPNYYSHKPSYQSSHSVAHAPVDDSNLYGGLQPPPPEPSNTNLYGGLQPPPPEPSNSNLYGGLQAPPPEPSNTNLPSRSNVRINQIYPPILNATVHNLPRNPHYSHSYAGVAHSRNSSWSTANTKVPQHSSTPVSSTAKPAVVHNSQGAIYTSALQQDYDGATLTTSTERYGISPQPYNRQYYKTTTSLQPNEETVLDDDHNMNQLPISDALRMLLRPYFNRSGTVDAGTAKQAESHIMKLVSPPTTIQITSDPYITTTRRPTTPVQEDVELILAGEQHSLTNVAIQSGTHEVRTEFHLNQEKSKINSENANTNWQKPEHSRHFHLRHPNLPNPFTEGERSRAAPHQRTHLHHQHSRDFHLRHPNIPNPFNAAREDGADEELYDTPNPNAESTTPTSDTYYNIDLRTGTPSDECQFDCGNGKCVKNFEVCNGVNNCGNRQDESRCSHLGYEVRLTGGESSNMGRVEVKILDKWGLVCDDKFGLRDADVVCRELGFNLGASEVRGNSYYSPLEVNFSFAMDEVDCRGNETSLKDCEFKGWGVNNCGPDEVVGVVCKVPLLKCPNNYWLCSTSKECIPPTFVCDNTPDCADQSDESELVCNSPIEYRLEGGRSVNEGRLEIKYRGEWGSVCDDDFGVKEAQVVCNSLGFYGKPKIAKNVFGPGSGPIWLDQVSCFGNESSIDRCNHWTWGEHNCNHTEDVGIKCTAGPPPRLSTKIDIVTPADNDHHAVEEGQSRLEDIGLYSGRLERSSKFTTNQRRCGHFKDDIVDEYDHPEERVVNGTRAKRGRHPWQATIRTRGRGGISGHWCGAVLISKKHLLTAAHCLAGYPKGAYFVRMGDHYANIAESSEIDSYIENWYIHEKFRDTTHMNNDIALIVLKHPVRFNDYIQPICLPENDTPMQENRVCTISGWGSIKSGVSTPSNILRAAQLPILAEAVCKQPHVYGGSMTDGMFCAGSMDESVDACDGDSGGPLVCSDDVGDTLYGIISWGQHCGYANKPGVYVRVGKYIDWIYDKINFSIEKAGS